MAKLIFSLLQIALLAQPQLTTTCIIKAKQPSSKELKFPGPWNDVSIQRTVGSCECGKGIPSNENPWSLYIHVSTDQNSVICSGTIITSNLVATSHDCVRAPGKKLNVFDSWNISPEHKGFVKISAIKVTSSMDVKAGESFPVLQLIPNPQYVLSWATKSEKLGYDSLDLLLIKVQADFTTHKEHRPICIPENPAADLDFVGQMGHYYTAADNPSLKIHEGMIFTRKICEANINEPTLSPDREDQDEVSGLCFRWMNQVNSLPPDLGGPLFIKSKHHSLFLAGVASNMTAVSKTSWIDYAYFSNIIPMLKYLEYRAHQHNSSWCKTPSLVLEDKQKLSRDNGDISAWPWENESIQQTFKTRDESLDCVCGVPNKELSGRIVGGVEATPYEFGWMASLNMYSGGRSGGSSYCGGAIINNRMILTAAHCMVSGGRVIKPENVDVLLNVHSRKSDPNVVKKVPTAVIVHPNYILADRAQNKYFDFDIALLVLKDDLKFLPLPEEPVDKPTPNLRPVCLPKMGEKIELLGEQVMVAGWGRTQPDDSSSGAKKMQKIELPVIPLQGCRDAARSRVTDRFLCAGSLNKFKDAAAGDSGGPLSLMRGRQWTEIGIVSWGQDEWKDGVYNRTAALYTDVTHPEVLPFVDYFARRQGVQWCKSEIPG